MNNNLVFEDIVKIVSNNKSIKLPDNIKLDFYKFYKQATEGDCNTSKPEFYKLYETAKWNAWNSVIGMSKEDAKNNYCNLYESIV